MASMFAASAASRRATSANARAGSGRPSTTSTWREPSGAEDGAAATTSTATCTGAVALACSIASCRPSGSWSVPTSTPRTSWPRIVTCSTSIISTPWRVSTANSTAETPGLAGPVTVIRTGVLVGGWVTGRQAASVVVDGLVGLVGRLVLHSVRQPLRRGVRHRRLVLAAEGTHVLVAVGVLDGVRVVQVERGPLGPDPRQLLEVVPRRRGRRGPLERVAVAPRVVGRGELAVPV